MKVVKSPEQEKEFQAMMLEKHGGPLVILGEILKKAEANEDYIQCAQIKKAIDKINRGEQCVEITAQGVKIDTK